MDEYENRKNQILKHYTMKRYPILEKQWAKMMFSFFDYAPMKKKEATNNEWLIRHMIWDFKNGKSFARVANLVADKIIKLYGNNAKNIVFACIPASSANKNEIRYKKFSEMVCAATGAINAYSHIDVEGERLAIHEYNNGKKLKNTEVINFDKDFFRGKKVIVFDDILTKGFSYAIFANNLEKFGANVLGGLFLGKTILI